MMDEAWEHMDSAMAKLEAEAETRLFEAYTNPTAYNAELRLHMNEFLAEAMFKQEDWALHE